MRNRICRAHIKLIVESNIFIFTALNMFEHLKSFLRSRKSIQLICFTQKVKSIGTICRKTHIQRSSIWWCEHQRVRPRQFQFDQISLGKIHLFDWAFAWVIIRFINYLWHWSANWIQTWALSSLIRKWPIDFFLFLWSTCLFLLLPLTWQPLCQFARQFHFHFWSFRKWNAMRKIRCLFNLDKRNEFLSLWYFHTIRNSIDWTIYLTKRNVWEDALTRSVKSKRIDVVLLMHLPFGSGDLSFPRSSDVNDDDRRWVWLNWPLSRITY